ncbi:MmcQ/YjbR family DNA-binding protein [Arachidicoccus soli]|uniref:MmcQ/YjbR family DNA-binding protein n=1 Tax=Arachidicoccus soli TaxID=2341117 RepID=A0A386HUC4_9BACT|nr:MmcQ/YjbR family DNA-binding protein [Arachidicoccus soli]AYD49121.1 MmcQ/YjbR family DNA-binding protein [Arachidicoccus soli]
MFIDEIRDYALELNKEVEECFPFGEATFVYKISGKIFLLMSPDHTFLHINVKCDPEKAIELREQYAAITPGYHMNKKHWNTLIIDGSLGAELIKECILHAYQLVVKKK